MKAYHKLIVGLYAMVLAEICSAQADGLSFDGINQRETALTRLKTAFSDYNYERQRLLLGEQSLVVRVERSAGLSRDWINGYSELVKKAKDIDDLNRMQSEIQSSLRDLTRTKNLIKIEHMSIRDLIASSARSISYISSLAATEELRSVKASIDRDIRSFKSRLDFLSQSLELNMTRMDKISEAFSADLFISRYQSLAIKQGVDANSPVALAFKDFIEGEIFYQKVAVEPLVNRIDSAMSRLEGEHLKVLMKDLETNCAQNINVITASGLSDGQKSRLKGEVEGLCDKARRDYKGTILIYSPGELAQSMHASNLNSRFLRKACNSEGPACDAYSMLKKIPEASVAQYGAEAIQNLESRWRDLRVLMENKT